MLAFYLFVGLMFKLCPIAQQPGVRDVPSVSRHSADLGRGPVTAWGPA
jgi:hypothetical protein